MSSKLRYAYHSLMLLKDEQPSSEASYHASSEYRRKVFMIGSIASNNRISYPETVQEAADIAESLTDIMRHDARIWR